MSSAPRPDPRPEDVTPPGVVIPDGALPPHGEEWLAGASLAAPLLGYRDSGDTASEWAVGKWVWTRADGGSGLLTLLAHIAFATLHEIHGACAEEVTRRAIAAMCQVLDEHSSAAAHQAVCDDEGCQEGYRSAAALVQHLLRADNQSRDLLLDHLLGTPNLVWGTATGLADIILTAARTQWGDAAEWIRVVHRATTLRPHPDDATAPSTIPGLAWPVGSTDALSGANMAAALLAHRDSGDTAGEQQVATWMSAHPGEGAQGVLLGLIGCAFPTLREIYGPDAQRVTAHAITTANQIRDEHHPPPGDDLDEQALEGYRCAFALMQHLLRADNDARNQIMRRMLHTPCLAWGAALGLADIVLNTARAEWGQATEFVRTFQAATTWAATHTSPALER